MTDDIDDDDDGGDVAATTTTSTTTTTTTMASAAGQKTTSDQGLLRSETERVQCGRASDLDTGHTHTQAHNEFGRRRHE